MDSKLKSVVITIVSLAVISVVAIVVLLNWRDLSRRYGNKAGTTVSTAVSIEEAAKKDSKQLGDDLDAWKKDETFFDSEADTLAAKLMEDMVTLSVKAVSVEGDVRVQILDYKDELKTGEAFKVNVSKTGGRTTTLTDSDKDGVLYADGLEPGEYSVVLLPYDGFNVPDNGLLVRVKEHVEYKKIEDIHLLIHEADKEEPAHVISAEGYADKKQNTKYVTEENRAYGVDVSSINGEIDWGKVYSEGLDFVFIRAGYRDPDNGKIIVDSRASTNVHMALRAGLDVGLFFSSQAINRKEAVEEASAVLEMLETLNITYPVMIRVDSAGGEGRGDVLDSDTRTEIAEAFCETIQSAGYDAGVYASSNWLMTNLDAKKLEKYHIWMAEYTRTLGTKDYYFDLWQYTSKGTVPGIEGEVCLSVSYIEE